jgi:hypothetical protein
VSLLAPRTKSGVGFSLITGFLLMALGLSGEAQAKPHVAQTLGSRVVEFQAPTPAVRAMQVGVCGEEHIGGVAGFGGREWGRV